MYQTNNFLIRTYNFTPETFELKPPLLTWFQVGSLHVFGLNELGLRMPSVLFSIITLLLLFLLVYKMTNNPFLSLLAATITATSAGFYAEHSGRFGDHEALLVCISTWLFYTIYQYSTTLRPKYIYLAGMSIALGILCKSVAIGMVIPGLILFLIYDKKILGLLRSRHTYLAFIIAMLPVFAYYYFREQVQPGYLNLVWTWELFPRFFNTATEVTFKDAGFNYYFKLLKSSKMEFWVWSFILILLAPLFTKNIDRKWSFWVIPSVVFLLVISSGTKNFWYLAPVVPMLAGAVAISSYLLIKNKAKRTLWVIVPLSILATLSYQKAYEYAFNPEEQYFEWETNGISHFLKNENHTAKLSSNTKILLDEIYGYEPHMFYLRKLDLEHGVDIKRTELYRLEPNDTLLISHLSTLHKLKENYTVRVLDSSYTHTKLLTITPLVQVDSIGQLSSVE
jgi:4-amino-4-deoxy-L-arabinose transferase-like glycosyltransferase